LNINANCYVADSKDNKGKQYSKCSAIFCNLGERALAGKKQKQAAGGKT